MKGLGIAQLLALRLLAQRGERPQHDLLFLAVPDEEVGGTQGMAWLAQQRPDLLDVDAVWDEGGIGVTDVLPAPALFISVTEKQVLWLRIVAEGPAGHGSRPFPGAAPRRRPTERLQDERRIARTRCRSSPAGSSPVTCGRSSAR